MGNTNDKSENESSNEKSDEKEKEKENFTGEDKAKLDDNKHENTSLENEEKE